MLKYISPNFKLSEERKVSSSIVVTALTKIERKVNLHDLRRTACDEEKTSESETDIKTEGDLDFTTSDEPSAIIDDQRGSKIPRNLKLNSRQYCIDHESPSSNPRDDDSDLKSSSPEECRKKKWPLKRRKYVDTSLEDLDTSSDGNNAKNRKNKNRMKTKIPVTLCSKTSSLVNASPKTSSRQRSNFSFFNTLFDIVFWPYLFLKTNR
ncbi:uncharacterized protein LOC143342850 [Colletes latitarsis]|uniref:uncharacterized protein LOC143342850 n=1 Tax=Colletes latitarsis TaxID=2605962 RepID=UPI004036B6EF